MRRKLAGRPKTINFRDTALLFVAVALSYHVSEVQKSSYFSEQTTRDVVIEDAQRRIALISADGISRAIDKFLRRLSNFRGIDTPNIDRLTDFRDSFHSAHDFALDAAKAEAAQEAEPSVEEPPVSTDIIPASPLSVEQPISRSEIMELIEGGLNKMLAGIAGKTVAPAGKTQINDSQADLFSSAPKLVEASVPAVVASDRIEIWGRHIRRDANGLVCLNDLYKAVGSPKNQDPSGWRELKTTKNLVKIVAEKTPGKSGERTKTDEKSVIYSKGGIGTFAHANLAIEYAGYLSPKLRVEVNDVFLQGR